MSLKVIVLCVSAVLVKAVMTQCIDYAAPTMRHGCGCGNWWAGNRMDWAGKNYGIGRESDLVDSYGGALKVTSSSPLAPRGLQVISENRLDGDLAVLGQLPFLGAVALDCALPSSGEAHTEYGCGNGHVRILETYGGAGKGYGAIDKLALDGRPAGHKWGSDIIVNTCQ